MIVRVPEIEIGIPSRSTVLSILSKSIIAVCLVSGLVLLADWRLNSRMDKSGLERLAADTTSEPALTGSIGPKSRKR